MYSVHFYVDGIDNKTTLKDTCNVMCIIEHALVLITQTFCIIFH